MSTEISKQEYLKRYLEKEKDSNRKRKKKPKKKAQVPSLKIINEDIDLKSLDFGKGKEEDEDDEAPIIAEIIDDRPIEAKMKEQYQSSRWKKLDDEDYLSNSIKERESKEPNLDASFSTEKSASEKNYDKGDKNNFRRSRHDSDSDLSPSRHLVDRKRKESNGNNQPSKRNRSNSTGSDISPPRNQKQSKSRHDSDSDISPPRHNSSKTYSRQKSSRHHSDSDLSPPRSKLSKTATSSRQKRHDSDSDLSPPRHKLSKSVMGSQSKPKHHDSDSDLSPPRPQSSSSSQKKHRSERTNSDSDISPPRHRVSHKSKSQTKSSSGRYNSDDERVSSKNRDHLPGRLKTGSEHTLNKNRSDYRSVSPSSPESFTKDRSRKLDKTLSGLKAGLQQSKTLQMEVQELRERERNQLNMLGDEISGRNAGTVVRDRKTGLKRDLNQEQQKKKEEDMKTKEYQEKYAKWGKGIEQQVDRVEKFKDDIYEMSKPLARYQDDEDLDERLKSVMREDDPMAEYIKKKKQKDTPSYPKYKGPPAPPNRFGLEPGFRWDGVDRSNGFEKKYFEKVNKTKATEREAYLWSVQDM